ncbi:MAG: hypothetical protein ACK58L_13640 [Planctomycetota bacterium]
MTQNAQSEQAPRWLRHGIVVLLTLVAANLLAWRTIEPDLWGHIQYGEDWIVSGSMPLTATHTFTAEGYPWVNHENLFELAVAVGQRTIGGHGLMIFKCVSGLWLLWTMVRVAQNRHVPTIAAVAAMVPVASGLAEFWLARPQLFSFLCFGLMLLAFERAFRLWTTDWSISWRWLWLCVPLMVVWTNSHGGFAAGLCVFLAIAGLRTMEILWKTGRAGLVTATHLSVLNAVMIVSVFLNPYGYELPYWMLVSLSQPRPEVSEWANILDGGVTAIPFLALSLLTLVSLISTRCRRDWVELIVLGLIAVQTLGHVRHLAFFAIAFGYWMPQHLVSIWSRLVEWRPTLAQHDPISGRAASILKAEFAAIALSLVGMLGWSFANFGVDRTHYPVNAIEFMTQNNLHGRLVVTFDWAQYALAALTPRTTVGFDGRYDTCYPQSVVDMHFDLLFGQDTSRRHRGPDSGPVDSNRVLTFGHPDLVLMDQKHDQAAVEFIRTRPEWVMLYQDGTSVLWGRASVYDDPAGDRHFPVSMRVRTDERPQGIAPWPGFPNRTGRDAFHPTVAEQALRMFDQAEMEPTILSSARSSATR